LSLESQEFELYWTHLYYCEKSQSISDHTTTLVFDEYIVFLWSRYHDMTNNILIYNIKTNVWEKFLVVGEHPGQQSGHSACLYKENQIIIFGGKKNYNEMAHDTYALIISKEESSK